MAKGGLKDVLLGVGVGVCIGALLTPRTGEENRKLLKEKAQGAIKKVKSIDYEALKEKLYDDFYNLKDEIANMDRDKAIALAKEKGAEIEAKADKIIASAIENGKPKVEKALVELKKKVAVVLKDLSEKLDA